MSATPVTTFVKKSVGWSIVLSALMIVAGILAIASPLAAGMAVNVLVGWLLIFSGCAHLVFAWYAHSGGGVVWELAGRGSLHFHRSVSAHASVGGVDVTDDCAGRLPVSGGDFGVCHGIHTPTAPGIGLAGIRWGRHSRPCCHDLEDLAN